MASLNPQGMAELQRRVQARAVQAAGAAAQVLDQKLAGEGSGTKHAGLPHRSSAPGEYPAEQSGDLRESVGSRPAGEIGAEFGLIGAPEHAAHLHFKPPQAGGRPVMDLALADDDIQRAVQAGFKDGGR